MLSSPVGLEPTTFELRLKISTRSPTRYPLRHGDNLAHTTLNFDVITAQSAHVEFTNKVTYLFIYDHQLLILYHFFFHFTLLKPS